MDSVEVKPPHYVQVGSPEKRRRWEEEQRQWEHAYADAQANRLSDEIRRGVPCTSTFDAEFFVRADDDEPLGDDDFRRRLKAL